MVSAKGKVTAVTALAVLGGVAAVALGSQSGSPSTALASSPALAPPSAASGVTVGDPVSSVAVGTDVGVGWPVADSSGSSSPQAAATSENAAVMANRRYVRRRGTAQA